MRSPIAVLALAWVAGFTLIDSAIVSLALPDIARDFQRTVGELAWVSSGFLLALAASLLPAGRLGDRYGVRAMMAFGAIAFGVTTLICGIAPTFEILVAARVAQGAAGGILYTISLAIVTTRFPAARRATAISIYFTSGALSAVIGPVVGGWLTDVGGWRAVFLAQLPIPILLLVMTFVVLSPERGKSGAFDVPGVVSASAFIAAATFAILQLAVPGGHFLAAIVGLAAVVALVAFVWFEKRAIAPAVRLSIFRNVRFVVGSVCGAGAWFAIMSQQVYVAIYLQLGRLFDATVSGLLLLAAPLVGLVLFPVAGAVVGRAGIDRSLLAGVGLTVVAGAGMIGWGGATEPWVLFAVLLVSGLGISLTLVASATDALGQFAPHEAATGSAVFNSIRQLGAAIGVAAPAVAFELVARGSRTPDAALAGSTAAFALRTIVLLLPLIAVLVALAARRRARPVDVRPVPEAPIS